METLQAILSKIKNIQKENKPLNYQETISVFNAIKHLSKEKIILEKIIALVLFSKENEQLIKSLSRRESEIFKLIGLGFSSREISNLLTIKEVTVCTHRKNIIRKLQLSGFGQLQKISIQHIYNQA